MWGCHLYAIERDGRALVLKVFAASEAARKRTALVHALAVRVLR